MFWYVLEQLIQFLCQPDETFHIIIIYLFIYLFICLFVCLFICLFIFVFFCTIDSTVSSYLAGNVDERVPRYGSFLAEHFQVEQCAVAIAVVKLILSNNNDNHVVNKRKPGTAVYRALADISRSALCAPIAKPPNSTQLEDTPTIRAVVWECGEGQAGTQTRVTNIHFASATLHAKCNYITKL